MNFEPILLYAGLAGYSYIYIMYSWDSVSWDDSLIYRMLVGGEDDA